MDKAQITTGYRTLRSAPTSAEQGDAFFFSSPELNQLLDLLRHLTVNSDRIPLVRGQAGVGKSTVLSKFQSEAPDNWKLCRIDANLMLQPEQLFSLLGEGFGVEVDDERVIERLIHRFEDLHREGVLPVILVDDAHLLPVATVISLLRIYERHPESHTLTRILLFASPQIDDLLKTPQIQAMNLQLLQRFELLPLNQEQTEQMIQQMLSRHGLTDQLQLTHGQLEKLYRDTAGLPGEITHRLEQLLARESSPQPLSSSARQQRSFLAGLSIPTLAGAILVAIALLLTLLYEDEINALFQGKESAKETVSLPPVANETLVPLKLPEPEGSLKEQDVVLAEGGPEVVTKSGMGPKLALPEVNAEPELVPGAESPGALEIAAAAPDQVPTVSEPVATEADPLSSAPETTAAMERFPDPAMDRDRWSLAVPLDSKFADTLSVGQPSEASATAFADGDQNSVGQPEEMIEEAQILVAATTLPSHKAAERSASLVPVPAVGAKESRPVPKVSVAAQASKIPADGRQRTSAADMGIHRDAWLLRQDSSTYTLQLIGVQEEKAVERFVRTHQLVGPVAYFRSLRNDRAWFSVVYGIYSGRDEAVAGRAQLPVALRNAGVWPRSLESVQQAIRGN